MKMSFIVDAKNKQPVCVNVGGVTVTLQSDPEQLVEPIRISLDVQPAKKKEKQPADVCEASAEVEEAPAVEPEAAESYCYDGSALQAATHRLMEKLHISEEDAWRMLLSELEEENPADDNACLYS